MAGVRFLLAGSLLYSWGVGTGFPRPTGRHWRNAIIGGIPLFVIGNGGVTWAEQTVPSGLAALIVATLPAWLLLLEWLIGARSSPALIEIVGIGLGLSGVAVLATPNDAGTISIVGVIVLIVSSIAWAIGSLLNRHADLPASPIRTAGMQMLSSGAIMLLIGITFGELAQFTSAPVSVESIVAFAYLVAVAIVAVPAYTWLLTASTPALVGTYAFVNPVVAVLLGWALANETVSGRTGLSVILVTVGVGLLTWPRKQNLIRSQ